MTGPLPEIRFEPAGPPLATVIALHGFNDRKAAFTQVGEWLAGHGYRLVAYDQAGYGARPDRGFFAGTEQLVRELLFRIRVEHARAPGLPIWVLGESMGGAVTLVAAARAGGDLPVVGLILSAPAVWGGELMGPFYRLALASAMALAPDLILTGRGLNILASDNIPLLRELALDPLYLAGSRIDAINGIVRLMDEADEAGPHVRLPVTILNGEIDQVIVPEVQKAFVARMPAETCREIRYPEGWHLLLRDLQRELVFQDILKVLEGQRPGRPCGVTRDAPPPRS